MNNIFKIFIFFITLCILYGCKVGPNYKRPDINLGDNYRFAKTADTSSIATIPWQDIFADTVLKGIINKGLQKNFDLLITYQNIIQARASLKSAKAQMYPNFNASINGGYQQQALAKNQILTGSDVYGTVGFSWEVDIWGKLRRQTESAKAQLFATEANLQAAKISLITEIALTYFELVNYNNQLAISKDNIRILSQNYELVKAKLMAGTASGLDASQAQSELASAEVQVPTLENAVALTENALSLLIGELPSKITPSKDLLSQINYPLNTTSGVPAQLITLRPDIIEAEQTLISANAQIGVARAYMLPTLSINPNIGYNLPFESLIYSAVGSLVAPIWGQGRLKANLFIARSQKEQMLINYQKIIYNSIAEVSNALIDLQKKKEITLQVQESHDALLTTYNLSNQLYQAGYASYLDLIVAERGLFQADINLSSSQKDQLTAYINLYKALGGGLK